MALQGELVPAVHRAVVLEDAHGLQAMEVLLIFQLPSISSQTPRKELFFSLCIAHSKSPQRHLRASFGSARPHPSPALREQPQLWCFNPPTCPLGCWDGMAAHGLMGFSPLQQQASAWASAMVHGLDAGAQRCKEVSSQKPKAGGEKLHMILGPRSLPWPLYSLSLQVIHFAHPCLQAGFF